MLIQKIYTLDYFIKCIFNFLLTEIWNISQNIDFLNIVQQYFLMQNVRKNLFTLDINAISIRKKCVSVFF